MLACDFWSLSLFEIFSTSVHSILFSSFLRATFNTSSTFSTTVIFISSRIFFGISIKSFSFSFGIITCFIPALWAHRAGIKQVIIPKENEKDLIDIPKKIREDIKITVVENVDEVLKVALKNELKRIEWTEVENISKSDKDQKSQASIQ